MDKKLDANTKLSSESQTNTNAEDKTCRHTINLEHSNNSFRGKRIIPSEAANPLPRAASEAACSMAVGEDCRGGIDPAEGDGIHAFLNELNKPLIIPIFSVGGSHENALLVVVVFLLLREREANGDKKLLLLSLSMPFCPFLALVLNGVFELVLELVLVLELMLVVELLDETGLLLLLL